MIPKDTQHVTSCPPGHVRVSCAKLFPFYSHNNLISPFWAFPHRRSENIGPGHPPGSQAFTASEKGGLCKNRSPGVGFFLKSQTPSFFDSSLTCSLTGSHRLSRCCHLSGSKTENVCFPFRRAHRLFVVYSTMQMKIFLATWLEPLNNLQVTPAVSFNRFCC